MVVKFCNICTCLLTELFEIQESVVLLSKIMRKKMCMFTYISTMSSPTKKNVPKSNKIGYFIRSKI